MHSCSSIPAARKEQVSSNRLSAGSTRLSNPSTDSVIQASPTTSHAALARTARNLPDSCRLLTSFQIYPAASSLHSRPSGFPRGILLLFMLCFCTHSLTNILLRANICGNPDSVHNLQILRAAGLRSSRELCLLPLRCALFVYLEVYNRCAKIGLSIFTTS